MLNLGKKTFLNINQRTNYNNHSEHLQRWQGDVLTTSRLGFELITHSIYYNDNHYAKLAPILYQLQQVVVVE